MTQSIITILGGSKTGRRPELTEATRELVIRLVASGYRIRYGGGSTGLMGTIADVALEEGGHVHGIIPEFLATSELLHPGLSAATVVDTMSVRKRLLLTGVDAVIVVPGGIGTLEEFFDVYSQIVLGQSLVRLAVYDCHGFWRPLRGLLASLTVNDFMSQQELACLPFLTTAEDVANFLAGPWAPPPSRTSRSAVNV